MLNGQHIDGEFAYRMLVRDAPSTSYQMELNPSQSMVENPDYLSQQLVTYIGNKRSLLGHIGKAVEEVKGRLGKQKLVTFDPFSGSGIVSRFLKRHSELVIANDLEDYATAISRCYLTNRSKVDLSSLNEIVEELNTRVEFEDFPVGFIQELYAPASEAEIKPGERVFYTPENARRLDNYRRLLDDCPDGARQLLLGPLLSEASVHSNTAGVFKGFYKDRSTGIGQFGGTGSDALHRIKGTIRLESPVLSNYECDYEVLQGDANEIVPRQKALDLVYIDPPYNQHPYGSNYFMLNLLVNYVRPDSISQVSGIPRDWRRSGYNVRSKSSALLQDLIENVDAPFLIISFNNEGFIGFDEMCSMLRAVGRVQSTEIPYNTFRGSRNLWERPIHVKEYLFLVERN